MEASYAESILELVKEIANMNSKDFLFEMLHILLNGTNKYIIGQKVTSHEQQGYWEYPTLKKQKGKHMFLCTKRKGLNITMKYIELEFHKQSQLLCLKLLKSPKLKGEGSSLN